MRLLAALFTATLLAACATTATTPPETPAQPAPSASTAEPAASAPAGTSEPPIACAGDVDTPPAGLVPADEAAPSFAIGTPGKGALCRGKVFTVKEPVTVYRVFTAKYETVKKAGPTGAYWSFTKPTGSMDAYRGTYEICAEWNDLDTLNECKVDAGAKIVLGPGQSADCDSGTKYPASAANQVLIVKGEDGKVPVSGCKQSPMAWGQ